MEDRGQCVQPQYIHSFHTVHKEEFKQHVRGGYNLNEIDFTTEINFSGQCRLFVLGTWFIEQQEAVEPEQQEAVEPLRLSWTTSLVVQVLLSCLKVTIWYLSSVDSHFSSIQSQHGDFLSHFYIADCIRWKFIESWFVW